MSEYFLEPNYFRGKIKGETDLSDYATKQI